MNTINDVESLLKKWWKKFQQYKIGYKDGVYQLNCLVNSPFTIVESLSKMPFSNIDRDKQEITINTFFAKSNIYYSNPEEGLWILTYHNIYKKNLMIKNIFDEKIPMEYNYVHFISKEDNTTLKPMLVNGVTFNDNTWSMAKVGQPKNAYHHKDTSIQSTLVLFTLDWLKTNKLFHTSIQLFFESKGKHVSISNFRFDSNNFYNEFRTLFQQGKHSELATEIKVVAKRFINAFSMLLDEKKLTPQHFYLADSDWKRILVVESYLRGQLLKSFPGIDKIASKVNVSPTKLKSDFKLIHQKTIYAYFQEQQMKIAYQMLVEKGFLVKDIAALLCYENSSKFTEVFKKHYDILPSELLKKNLG